MSASAPNEQRNDVGLQDVGNIDIITLPDVALHLILGYLSFSELLSIRLVSKFLRSAAALHVHTLQTVNLSIPSSIWAAFPAADGLTVVYRPGMLGRGRVARLLETLQAVPSRFKRLSIDDLWCVPDDSADLVALLLHKHSQVTSKVSTAACSSTSSQCSASTTMHNNEASASREAPVGSDASTGSSGCCSPNPGHAPSPSQSALLQSAGMQRWVLSQLRLSTEITSDQADMLMIQLHTITCLHLNVVPASDSTQRSASLKWCPQPHSPLSKLSLSFETSTLLDCSKLERCSDSLEELRITGASAQYPGCSDAPVTSATNASSIAGLKHLKHLTLAGCNLENSAASAAAGAHTELSAAQDDVMVLLGLQALPASPPSSPAEAAGDPSEAPAAWPAAAGLQELEALHLPDIACSSTAWQHLAQLPCLQRATFLCLLLDPSSTPLHAPIKQLHLQAGIWPAAGVQACRGCLARMMPELEELSVTQAGSIAAAAAAMQGHPRLRVLKLSTAALRFRDQAVWLSLESPAPDWLVRLMQQQAQQAGAEGWRDVVLAELPAVKHVELRGVPAAEAEVLLAQAQGCAQLDSCSIECRA